MAFRMAIDLGIHLPGDKLRTYIKSLTLEDIEIRKRLFWSCYTYDKVISLFLGRMPAFTPPLEGNFPRFCKPQVSQPFQIVIVHKWNLLTTPSGRFHRVRSLGTLLWFNASTERKNQEPLSAAKGSNGIVLHLALQTVCVSECDYARNLWMLHRTTTLATGLPALETA